MAMREVSGLAELRERVGATGSAWIGFFGAFSEKSERQLPVFRAFGERHPDKPLFLVDVGRVKDVHRFYQVGSVPTVIRVRGDAVVQVVAGERPLAEYEALLDDAPPVIKTASPQPQRTRRVVVYTTPTCTFCRQVKSYFQRRGVQFREVDISRDEAQARQMMAKSGQSGVPQVDIEGKIVVGFDKPQIDRLLGLSREAA